MIEFDANAAGNTFRILYGDEPALTQYLHNLRERDAWTFDTALTLTTPPLTNGSSGVSRMRIWERDGTESAMCGNGARAAAAVLATLGLPARIAVPEGVISVDRTDHDRWAVSIPDVRNLGFWQPPGAPADSPQFHLINVYGEPHAVAMVANLEKAPLHAWGRATVPIANCTVVTPEGTRLAAKTFERGIERETASCGTGAVAAATPLVLAGMAAPETIVTMNGHDLSVALQRTPSGIITATLEGPVSINRRRELS